MSVSTSPDDAASHGAVRAGVVAGGAVVGGAAVVLVVAATGWGLAGALASLPLVPAGIAAGIDVRARVLPDLVVAVTAGTATFVAVVARGGEGFAFVTLGAVLASMPLLVIHAVAPAALGFGDVKLGAALGATLGVSSPDVTTAALLALVMLAVASGAGLVVAVASRRHDVAFGALLLAGATIALMSADRLGGAPLSWQ